MHSSRHKVVRAAILLLSAAGLAYYIAANWDSFAELRLAQPSYALPAGVALMIGYIVVGRITQILTRSLGAVIGGREAWAISLMTGFYNMLLPFRAGMATRAAYLKARHGIGYADFLASYSATYILMNVVASALGAASLWSVSGGQGLVAGILLLTFFGILGSHLLVIVFSPSLHRTNHRWLDAIVRTINSWNTIRRDKRLVLSVTALSLVQVLLEALFIYCEFRAFGISVSAMACVFLASVGLLGLLIQITPAGFGVTEALLVVSAQALSITPAETLAATLLGRLVALIVLVALAPIASHTLLRGTPGNNPV